MNIFQIVRRIPEKYVNGKLKHFKIDKSFSLRAMHNDTINIVYLVRSLRTTDGERVRWNELKRRKRRKNNTKTEWAELMNGRSIFSWRFCIRLLPCHSLLTLVPFSEREICYSLYTRWVHIASVCISRMSCHAIIPHFLNSVSTFFCVTLGEIIISRIFIISLDWVERTFLSWS